MIEENIMTLSEPYGFRKYDVRKDVIVTGLRSHIITKPRVDGSFKIRVKGKDVIIPRQELDRLIDIRGTSLNRRMPNQSNIKKVIQEDLRGGLTIAHIATKRGVSESTVRRYM